MADANQTWPCQQRAPDLAKSKTNPSTGERSPMTQPTTKFGCKDTASRSLSQICTASGRDDLPNYSTPPTRSGWKDTANLFPSWVETGLDGDLLHAASVGAQVLVAVGVDDTATPLAYERDRKGQWAKKLWQLHMPP